jgi:hypothetical protein
MFQIFHQSREAYQRSKRTEPERAASLEDPSPATTACFKIETTCALCIATTVSTYERHNYHRKVIGAHC